MSNDKNPKYDLEERTAKFLTPFTRKLKTRSNLVAGIWDLFRIIRLIRTIRIIFIHAR